jgi:hypothetical protein
MRVNIKNVSNPYRVPSTTAEPIFVITTLRNPEGKNLFPSPPRAVGFYYKLQDSISAIEDNFCDIYEDGYYPIVVIEEVYAGIYTLISNISKEYWFKWNVKKDKYCKIKKPSVFSHMIGFGIS